jgi:hypothetical protein
MKMILTDGSVYEGSVDEFIDLQTKLKNTNTNSLSINDSEKNILSRLDESFPQTPNEIGRAGEIIVNDYLGNRAIWHNQKNNTSNPFDFTIIKTNETIDVKSSLRPDACLIIEASKIQSDNSADIFVLVADNKIIGAISKREARQIIKNEKKESFSFGSNESLKYKFEPKHLSRLDKYLSDKIIFNDYIPSKDPMLSAEEWVMNRKVGEIFSSRKIMSFLRKTYNIDHHFSERIMNHLKDKHVRHIPASDSRLSDLKISISKYYERI